MFSSKNNLGHKGIFGEIIHVWFIDYDILLFDIRRKYMDKIC